MEIENIEWLKALVGALIGFVVGFVFNSFINWSRRVKVKFIGFKIEEVKFGTLYKMRFKLEGHSSPGKCDCQLSTDAFTTFAKWDECPNPLKKDNLEEFMPEMVPETFQQQLYVKHEYSIPILIKFDNKFFVFDGWWFGRNKGYYNHLALNSKNKIEIRLRGNDFAWNGTYSLDEIIIKAS